MTKKLVVVGKLQGRKRGSYSILCPGNTDYTHPECLAIAKTFSPNVQFLGFPPEGNDEALTFSWDRELDDEVFKFAQEQMRLMDEEDNG